MNLLEQEKEVWKADTAASLAVKQLHTKEWLKLEKSKAKDKDIDLDRLRKDKAAAEKILDTKPTAKERLLRQVHSLKERAAKRKMSNIDPMEKYGTVRCDQEFDSRSTNHNWT